jgi:gliding motility-associated lipoprotein GldH
MKKLLIPLLALLVFAACDSKRVYDKFESIEENSWKYEDLKNFEFEIQDTSLSYQFYIQTRNTSAYNYSNFYMLLTLETPKGDSSEERMNFLLADETGKWLGDGSNGLYTCKIKVKDTLKFSEIGTYKATLKQDMRDNPLLGIADVGVRIEKLN